MNVLENIMNYNDFFMNKIIMINKQVGNLER